MKETVLSIKTLFIRDLDRLQNEITAYKDETKLWKHTDNFKNSSGNLCLHLCGNLKSFIGASIGQSGYIRKREDEFGLKNVPRTELLENIEETKAIITSTFEKFDVALLYEPFPIEVFGKPMSYIFFLIHLTGHLNYHLGQINCQRRLTE